MLFRSGLLALIDDIASLADSVGTMAATAAGKSTAMSRDVALLTKAAAQKTTGVVTDDMAVTAEQAVGLLPEREIPVVLAVARGSLKNKCFYLAPGALLLNAIAPWAITPVLMLGGTFLCFEGVEKVLHKDHGDEDAHEERPHDPAAYEKMRVEGAIRTDLILSAEIIAISLGEVASAPFLTQALALYGVSVLMTAGVYGIVGGLVKLDDLGLHLSQRGGVRARIGKVVLAGAPRLLHFISFIGTYAMLMVGGHILIHGFHPLAERIEHIVELVPHRLAGVTGLGLDILVGALAGLAVVGIEKTGLFEIGRAHV